MQRAYVLLSGGIDSTTCLALAYRTYATVIGVSIDYGQRHRKEIDYAKRSCTLLCIPHHVIDLSALIPKTMLTDQKQKIPSVSYAELEGISPTYVPFRNGLMLSALTSYIIGEQQNIDDGEDWAIYFGAHAEDAQDWAYPDCTPEFIGGMANAIYIGTYGAVRLCTPLQWFTKSQVIKLGDDLNVEWRNTWSCYSGGEKHCGVCPTCRARRDGFIAAGVDDPTDYAE